MQTWRGVADTPALSQANPCTSMKNAKSDGIFGHTYRSGRFDLLWGWMVCRRSLSY
jgi:hypothetical protein